MIPYGNKIDVRCNTNTLKCSVKNVTFARHPETSVKKARKHPGILANMLCQRIKIKNILVCDRAL